MIRTRVIGTGSYLPERVVSNQEIATALGIDPDHLIYDPLQRPSAICTGRAVPQLL